MKAINVGTHQRLQSKDLCALLAEMGFGRAQSILQSGNLIFDSNLESEGVEHRIETALQDRFGLKTEVYARDLAQVREICEGNPFKAEAASDPSHVLVLLAKKPARDVPANNLAQKFTGPERLTVVNGQLYLYYPRGMADTKLTARLIKQFTGVSGSARNWNTLKRVLDAIQN